MGPVDLRPGARGGGGALAVVCLLLTGLALLVLLPPVAAADQTDEALRLLTRADTLIDTQNARYGEVMDLWYEVAAIDPAGANAADASSLLDEMATGVQEMLETTESTVALYDQAAALDVPDELEPVLSMRKEIARLRVEELSLIGDSVAALQTQYGEWDRLGDAERGDLQNRIAKDYDAILVVQKTAAAKTESLDQYAEDLQRQADDSSDWWVDGLVFLAIGAVGGAIGSWIRRRRRRRGGSQELLKEGEPMSWEE